MQIIWKNIDVNMDIGNFYNKLRAEIFIDHTAYIWKNGCEMRVIVKVRAWMLVTK